MYVCVCVQVVATPEPSTEPSGSNELLDRPLSAADFHVVESTHTHTHTTHSHYTLTHTHTQHNTKKCVI